MATVSDAIERMAAATGIIPGTVASYARALREAEPGLWPKSGKGGGRKAAHVEAAPLVNLLLGFAGAQPSEAIEAVHRLRPLRCGTSRMTTPPLVEGLFGAAAWGRPAFVATPPDALALDLGSRLERLIDALATAKAEGRDDLAAQMRAEGWGLKLSPATPAAWLAWRGGTGPDEGAAQSDSYAPAQRGLPGLLAMAGTQLPPLRRTTSLDFALIEAAADLVADTLRHKRSLMPAGPDGSGTPESKAPDPILDRAPTGTSRPIPSNRRLHTRDGKGAHDSAQRLYAEKSAQAGHNPEPEPGVTYDDRAYPPVAAAA